MKCEMHGLSGTFIFHILANAEFPQLMKFKTSENGNESYVFLIIQL